ncbi:hypothetical protein BV25DRAFT_1832348 [Artomyces pyxidatus]|uniref:Uncharacterized protein n=1 Tax=Artomyces pyxidatus TaxID=48021 RepID=A0ACB8SKX1_9AGAM|nr:hypothetical protein BV25DRAFT_1832348 [Artomyces pyxidatus]
MSQLPAFHSFPPNYSQVSSDMQSYSKILVILMLGAFTLSSAAPLDRRQGSLPLPTLPTLPTLPLPTFPALPIPTTLISVPLPVLTSFPAILPSATVPPIPSLKKRQLTSVVPDVETLVSDLASESTFYSSCLMHTRSTRSCHSHIFGSPSGPQRDHDSSKRRARRSRRYALQITGTEGDLTALVTDLLDAGASSPRTDQTSLLIQNALLVSSLETRQDVSGDITAIINDILSARMSTSSFLRVPASTDTAPFSTLSVPSTLTARQIAQTVSDATGDVTGVVGTAAGDVSGLGGDADGDATSVVGDVSATLGDIAAPVSAA